MNNIEEIYSSFTKRNRDLLFPVKYLDEIPLDDERRLDIERKIVEFCLNGDTASFIYISHLRLVNVVDEFSINKLSNLSSYDKASILKILFSMTNDINYLNEILKISTNDIQVFSMLCYLYEDINNTELKYSFKECLKKVCNMVNNDKYTELFQKRIEKKKDLVNYGVIKSMLYGFAVGDALGVPVEFVNRERMEKNPVVGMRDKGTHNQPKGSWSDDTSMTIATMDSIADCDGTLDYDDIMNKYYSWYCNSKYTATGKIFDMGFTTRNALKNFKVNNVSATLCGGTDVRSNGNGSLMRMIPLVAFLNQNKYEEQGVFASISNYSSLTHRHDISILGCLIYYDFMSCLLKGMSCLDAYNYISNRDYESLFDSKIVNEYKNILSGNLITLSKSDISGSGYVVKTLESSLWCILNTDSYKDAVLTAVNLGEDTDTVGAITGSMAGLIYGFDSIPKEFIEDLKGKKLLDEISKKFYESIKKKHRISDHYNDMDPIVSEEDLTIKTR